MLGRLVWQSFFRAKRRKALALASVAIGVGVASGLIGLVTHMGDLVAQDLRRFGANIIVRPDTKEVPIRYGGVTLGAGSVRLRESDLPRIKRNFWESNILAFAPYLHASVREPSSGKSFVLTGTWFEKKEEESGFVTGVRKASPWWEVEGEWIRDDGNEDTVLLGARLAASLDKGVGDAIEVVREDTRAGFRIVGIVRTGGPEEDQAFTRIGEVQDLLGEPGAVSVVRVSALTRPRPADLKPVERMTLEERERFFCCPYPSNVAAVIEEMLPGSKAEPIAAVTRVEGDLLRKVEAVAAGMGAIAIVGAVLGVLAAMAHTVASRRAEMALMLVLGARPSHVYGQIAVEGAALGLVGGAIGFLLGLGIISIGAAVLGIPAGAPLAVLPLALVISVLVVLGGTLPPTYRVLRCWPIQTLRAEGI